MNKMLIRRLIGKRVRFNARGRIFNGIVVGVTSGWSNQPLVLCYSSSLSREGTGHERVICDFGGSNMRGEGHWLCGTMVHDLHSLVYTAGSFRVVRKKKARKKRQ